MEPLPTPERPWESISMDFIVAIPKSEAYGAIMAVDRLSKYSTFIPVTSECKVDEATREFFKNVLMGTELSFSASFHTRSDGQMERVNGLVEIYLRHYSPVEIVRGQTLSSLATPYTGNNPSAFKFTKELHEEADETRACLDKDTKQMKKWDDTKRRDIQFQVGDKIHPVVHVSLLKDYNEDKEDKRRNVSKRALPVVATAFDKEVKRIMADRDVQRRGVPCYKEYLFKWKGQPKEESSWEREDFLWQFEDQIRRYKDESMTRVS
ncbi:reverse transcriptase [Tanacetum coccineum]